MPREVTIPRYVRFMSIYFSQSAADEAISLSQWERPKGGLKLGKVELNLDSLTAPRTIEERIRAAAADGGRRVATPQDVQKDGIFECVVQDLAYGAMKFAFVRGSNRPLHTFMAYGATAGGPGTASVGIIAAGAIGNYPRFKDAPDLMVGGWFPSSPEGAVEILWSEGVVSDYSRDEELELVSFREELSKPGGKYERFDNILATRNGPGPRADWRIDSTGNVAEWARLIGIAYDIHAAPDGGRSLLVRPILIAQLDGLTSA